MTKYIVYCQGNDICKLLGEDVGT